MASLSRADCLRLQMRHATRAITARMMAPPTPTTTPMIVLRVCVDMPDVLPPFCGDDRLPVGVVSASVVTALVDPSACVIVVTNVDVEMGVVELAADDVVLVVLLPVDVGVVVVVVLSLVVLDVGGGVVDDAVSDGVLLTVLLVVSEDEGGGDDVVDDDEACADGGEELDDDAALSDALDAAAVPAVSAARRTTA